MHAIIKNFGLSAFSLVTFLGLSLLLVPAAQAKKALGDGLTPAMIADNPMSALNPFNGGSDPVTMPGDARSQLLDDHYEHLSQSGEGSTFYGFIPFASTPESIRKQYADWSLALSILGQLDRVIAALAA